MPQPSFATSGGIGIVKFGNQALPNGQGTLSFINLNDRIQWWCQPLGLDYDNHQLSLGQFVWRGRGAYLGDDWSPWKFSLPFIYDEDTSRGGSGFSLGQVLAQISQAGEQLLTFDNATGIPVKFSKLSNRKMLAPAPPYFWSFDLEFIAKAGWWQDLSATTISNQALNSGSATPFNVTYGGSVFAEPVWTLTIPVGNTAPIQSFALSNTMSGETLTLIFPGNLAGSTAWTITIDCGAFTVTDASGKAYDVSGSFPNLYPPAGQVNAMSATLTPASGTATGCTIGGSVTNRWLL